MVAALMMTYQCNFHCAHCMVDSSHSFSCVNKQVVQKFIEIVKKLCPQKVYLVGGEVLLHIDLVESITKSVKDFCQSIMIFSNGTFLLNEELRKRVEALGVKVRISDDRFHREQWSERLKDRIYSSKYYIVKPDDGTLDFVIPVGRAYEKFKECKRIPNCSLYTGIYDERYDNHHRFMVMMNGDVNLYCATIEGALANVMEDDITYELLVKRECILHNYFKNNLLTTSNHQYMAYICNECQKYRVTSENILYNDSIVANTKDYE